MKKALFLCVCSFVFVSACSLMPVKFEGTSMLPSISDGDKMLIDKDFGDLKRGDVVSFYYPKDKSKVYMKRIIGLPNENVEIREGKVYINGQLLDEPYLDENFDQTKGSFAARSVPEKHYFVLGDNRDNSSDPRYWGNVGRELIIGKLYMTYSKSNK